MTADAREALKWLALVLMLGDHVNTGLLGRSVPWLYDLGRIVMPTFAAVLAYNLVGAGNVENGRYQRSMRRLLAVGALAYPFHVMVLGQGWAVANILIGYAVAVGGMYAIDRWGQRGAVATAFLVIVAGGFIEFYWTAPLVTLAWWGWWRRPGLWALLGLLASFTLLCLGNGNAWALVALPLVLVSRRLPWRLPRHPWAFYAFYPVHLAVMAVVAMVMRV